MTLPCQACIPLPGDLQIPTIFTVHRRKLVIYRHILYWLY